MLDNLSLKETLTENRRDISIYDQETERRFTVVEYLGGADESANTITKMDFGVAGHWTAAEFKPNGRFIFDTDHDRFLDLDEKLFDKALKNPSSAYSMIFEFSQEHPGFSPVLWGGGRGSRTIYYKTKEEAFRAIENALLTDTWVIDSEPIRMMSLFPRCESPLETASHLDLAPGKESILADLYRIAGTLGKNESLELSGGPERFRIEVTHSKKEHPENIRLMIFLSHLGVPCVGHGCARRGWYDIGDQIAGFRLNRYDQEVAIGFPHYGQAISFPEKEPDGFQCRDCLHCTQGTSNKIYAHIHANGRYYAVWGPFTGKLRAKADSNFAISDKVWEKRHSGYDETNWERIPDFWARVQTAIAAV